MRAIVLLTLLLLSSVAMAQTGTLHGVITDESGAVGGRSYGLSAVIGIGEGQQLFHSETVRLKPNENGPIHLVLSLRGR